MKRYVCSVCGFVYDEAAGLPDAGIAPGTPWEALPDGWVCPICRAPKSAFRADEPAAETPQAQSAPEAPDFERELSPMEMSILCSNLARGCEKQHLADEAAQFARLAQHFRARASDAPAADFAGLLELVEADLSQRFPYAHATAEREGDRGARRALVWSEKVTNMLRSLLARYAEEGERMLEHTGVYVCTICGFVFVGDAPPELCPVCKVPNWKFEKVEGRAS